MAILTYQRLREILPETQTISETTLKSAILRAQEIVESVQGCDRRLDKDVYTENHSLNINSQSFYIDHFPIDTTQQIILEARLGNGHNDRVQNVPLPLQPFQVVDSNGYDINVETGEITIRSYYNNPAFYAYGRSSTLNGYAYTEAKITFTGGFDFCDKTNKEVQSIQVLFGSVLNFMLSKAGYYDGTGIKKKKVDKQYEVEFFDTASSSGANSFFNIPDSLMMPFHKYRPNLYDY